MDYTNLYEFQTASGVIVPDDSSVLLGVQQKFQEIFGTDIDLSAETPVGRLIEAFSVVIKTTLGVTAQNANQFNINEATGSYLDALAQIYGLQRIASTRTRLTIKCYFSDNQAGTDTIPAGALIMCSSNGVLFSIDSAIQNDGTTIEEETGRHYAIGSATAMESGVISAPDGMVNSIQTAVMGWTGVTNISPTYTGTDLETDEEFRKRILSSRPEGIGFPPQLVSSLLKIEEVRSACLVENNTGTPMVSKGIQCPPHSIYVGIDCIETADLLAKIAKVIASAKPIGTGMVKSRIALPDGGSLIPINNGQGVTVSYGYNNYYSQVIYFYQARKVAILVNLTYSNGGYSGDDIVSDIQKVISEYVASVGVGGIVYGTLITNQLINKLNVGIGTIWLQKAGNNTIADTQIEMMGYETPYSIADNITLTSI